MLIVAAHQFFSMTMMIVSTSKTVLSEQAIQTHPYVHVLEEVEECLSHQVKLSSRHWCIGLKVQATLITHLLYHLTEAWYTHRKSKLHVHLQNGCHCMVILFNQPVYKPTYLNQHSVYMLHLLSDIGISIHVVADSVHVVEGDE